jgi:DNA ligase-associated metallophosphoesterase
VNELAFTLAGEDVIATAERALVWQDTVFVADVHFGKDAMLRSAHHWTPPGSTGDNLGRLDTLLRRHSARRLVILGDLFHSAHGVEAVPAIRQWRNELPGCEILAIPGNHDRKAGKLANECGFLVEEEGRRLGPWALRHHPSDSPKVHTLCGHIHPVVSLRGSGRQSLKVPCFAITPNQCILPAFGVFTGGHPVKPRAGDQIIAIADGQLVSRFA